MPASANRFEKSWFFGKNTVGTEWKPKMWKPIPNKI